MSGEDDFDDFEIVPQDKDDDVDMWDVEGENEDEIKQAKIQSMASPFPSCLPPADSWCSAEQGLITAEAVSLAQALINRQTTRTDLINDGFHRYSLNSKDDLPSWFLDDEAKHYKSNIPITKEAVDALRAKMRALDARPIKKVAEAKARKKFKAAQMLEKAKKKAEGVAEMSDMTERDKARQIEKLMEKGTKVKKRKELKVVVAKGAHKGLKGRPKGVKGRYVMVDSRMKKEVSVLACSSRYVCSCVLAGPCREAERKGKQEAQTIISRTWPCGFPLSTLLQSLASPIAHSLMYTCIHLSPIMIISLYY